MTAVHPQSASARRILLTRAQDTCARWADALYPLASRLEYFTPFTTQPVALGASVRDDLLAAAHDDGVAWVITSARALEALQASDGEMLANIRQRIVFAVGDGSAQALRDAGFSRVLAAQGDITSLVSTILLHTPQQNIRRVIHLAGRVTVGNLADLLQQSPLQVDVHVVYDATLNALPADLAAALSSGAITDVILLSGRVAEHLGAAVAAHTGDGMPAVVGPARLYCLSPRIADIARAAFAPASPEIVTAPRPDIASLLTMIDAPVAGLHNITTDSAPTK